MNNQETVLTFAQGSLIAKNELVFELSLADQASYFIYCESAEAAERFAFQAKQLVCWCPSSRKIQLAWPIATRLANSQATLANLSLYQQLDQEVPHARKPD